MGIMTQGNPVELKIAASSGSKREALEPSELLQSGPTMPVKNWFWYLEKNILPIAALLLLPTCLTIEGLVTGRSDGMSRQLLRPHPIPHPASASCSAPAPVLSQDHAPAPAWNPRGCHMVVGCGRPLSANHRRRAIARSIFETSRWNISSEHRWNIWNMRV